MTSPSGEMEQLSPSGIKSVNGCLVVASGTWPPYITGAFPNLKGSFIELFSALINKLGICFQLVSAKDKKWGVPFANGSWNGMMGQLQRKEVDLAIGPFGTTWSRGQSVDFSNTIFSSAHCIMIPKPGIESDLLGFVRPFTIEVWVTVLTTVILVTLTAMIFYRVNHKRVDNDTDSDVHSEEHSIKPPSFLWGFMVLVGQMLQIKRTCSRSEGAIAMLWLLAALVIGSVYKSNLRAMLIAPIVRLRIQSLEDLVNQRKTPWAFVNGGVVHHYFESSYESDPNSIAGKAWKGGEFITAYSSFDKLLSGYAGIDSCKDFPFYMGVLFSRTGKCGFYIAPEALLPVHFSMAFQKGSKIKGDFDKLITRLRDTGILPKLFAPRNVNETICDKSSTAGLSNRSRSLQLEDFLGVFSLFAVGLVGGVLSFLLELLFRPPGQKNQISSTTVGESPPTSSSAQD